MERCTDHLQSRSRQLFSVGISAVILLHEEKILTLSITANSTGYLDTNTCQLNRDSFFSCRSKTILDSCPYLSILALHWSPQQINGHRFEGKEGDYIQIPERFLDAPEPEVSDGKNACALVQFVEYSSQQWFVAGDNLPALRDKVTSHFLK